MKSAVQFHIRVLLCSLFLCSGCTAWAEPDPPDRPGPPATCPDRVVATTPEGKSCHELLKEIEVPANFVRNGQMRLDLYEQHVIDWLSNHCYRSVGEDGEYLWAHDASARDTGPFLSQTVDGELQFFEGSTMTHGVARIWYSREMIDWMRVNRPADEERAPKAPPRIPNGAIMVKEMWHPPASRYAGKSFDCKSPFDPDGSGTVIFVRDNESFSSRWFSGWYGAHARNDWPPGPANSFTAMGQGGAQYCINCHASTKPALDPTADEPIPPPNTFASMKNLVGAGFSFLSQQVADRPMPSRHALVTLPPDRVTRLGEPLYVYDEHFEATFGGLPNAPTWQSIQAPPWKMPSRTFDSVLVPGEGDLDQFFTSSQCVGCHQANATGLQYDMFISNPHPDQPFGDLPVSVSPYSLWSSSPMGLGGRDPIFFAQLESEQVLHADPPKHSEKEHDPRASEEKGKSRTTPEAVRILIQNTCLTCHGNMAQRQQAIDAECGIEGRFERRTANAVPFPAGDAHSWAATAQAASYGALARDGISCTTCHHYRPYDYEGNPTGNECVKSLQKTLNPTQTGLARTFTGTFLVGPPDEIYGQYPEPKTKPMLNALRTTPMHAPFIQQSEMCASCHTIHLPVLDNPALERADCEDPLAYVESDDPFRCFPKRYEQTTYPEWAFSEFRTDEVGGVPAGSDPRSCQDCHMPHEDGDGSYQSKIAAIEEYTNYPETDYRLPAPDIDLPVRDNFARHYLVGLNVFFVKMAQQFPDVLGIPTADAGSGPDVPPLVVTEQKMLDQATADTATIKLDHVEWDSATGTLEARVEVENLVGHKFPSGVSFRRAFIELSVLDERDKVLWASGRTNESGVIVDERGEPVAGEFWWEPSCKARVPPPLLPELPYQPHFSTQMPVEHQNQAQIYQELYMNNARPPMLTTSFLSIGKHVKDNRLQPKGFLGEIARFKIARALGDPISLEESEDEEHGMDESFAFAVRPWGRAELDPDYCNSDDCTGTGIDTLSYRATVEKRPAKVRARLFYQAIPPYYLQDRFCVSQMANGTTTSDTERLYFLAGHLNVDGTAIDSWKLEVADTGEVSVKSKKPPA